MAKVKPLNKTAESIFTLLGLFILIEQALQALTKNEEILDSEFDENHNSFEDLVANTIQEALVWQILIKTCSFLDEWNTVFGVKTEDADKSRILDAKAIAKPAHKQLSHWKQLKEFRNEMIAHNHRDKSGKNIFLQGKAYHYPNSLGEVYLMCYCLKKMMDVIKFFFQNEVEQGFTNFQKIINKKPKTYKILSGSSIKKIIKELNIAIDDPLAIISMRIEMLESLGKVVMQKKHTVTIL